MWDAELENNGWRPKKEETELQEGKGKKGTFQKLKAHNKSGSGDSKSKLLKAIKKDQGLKSIMLTMATEKQNNQALISSISASNIQDIVSVLTVLPTPPSVATSESSDAAIQPAATIATLSRTYPATTLKLKNFIKNEIPLHLRWGELWGANLSA